MPITYKTCLVIVDRDTMQIPTEVAEHEVPILEAIHGRGAVTVLETYDEGAEVESPDAEHARLRRKYTRQNTNPVLSVFPRGPSDLAAALGVRYAPDANDPDVQQAVINTPRPTRNAPAPDAEPDESDAPKPRRGRPPKVEAAET